ncbi:hypothetical protein AB1Y20_011729 [Prymnesium parvum]|uniref:Uncharacterized protein n=1 Tax=Prymnesium parvum TaxID=97485 RepID=A0AB34IKN7_PRYPA
MPRRLQIQRILSTTPMALRRDEALGGGASGGENNGVGGGGGFGISEQASHPLQLGKEKHLKVQGSGCVSHQDLHGREAPGDAGGGGELKSPVLFDTQSSFAAAWLCGTDAPCVARTVGKKSTSRRKRERMRADSEVQDMSAWFRDERSAAAASRRSGGRQETRAEVCGGS